MLLIDRNNSQCWIYKGLLEETVYLFFLLKGNTLRNDLLYMSYKSESWKRNYLLMFATGRDYRMKSWGRENLGLQCKKRQITGKSEVLGQLWENDQLCKTREIGGTEFVGDRGLLPLTVYQDLGRTHLPWACEPGVLLWDLTLDLLIQLTLWSPQSPCPDSALSKLGRASDTTKQPSTSASHFLFCQ